MFVPHLRAPRAQLHDSAADASLSFRTSWTITELWRLRRIVREEHSTFALSHRPDLLAFPHPAIYHRERPRPLEYDAENLAAPHLGKEERGTLCKQKHADEQSKKLRDRSGWIETRLERWNWCATVEKHGRVLVCELTIPHLSLSTLIASGLRDSESK